MTHDSQQPDSAPDKTEASPSKATPPEATQSETAPPMATKLKMLARSWGPFIVIALVVYFGNVEVQTYLGKQALENTGLQTLQLDDAIAKAKAENKLVLADMSAIWCPQCRKLDNSIFANNEVKQAINDKYIFARVEYESAEGEAFMDKYGVKAFPTLLVLDQQGNKLEQLKLTFEPSEFIQLL